MEKTKIFDMAQENFKKIFTKDGINHQAFIDFITNTIQLVPDEDKSGVAAHAIMHLIIEGSYNFFEALGILESVKLDYSKSWEESMAQQEEDDN